ncbi:MAG: hypothetical protein CVU51_10705 [Deltaproteobacteria bacterium HGW-Deltaproteobacteria-1]|nr:MAG: hypothetical protein CVU51_10705 [Deltaproteobacteria bacterium HGW-Deltaproteobacteria-1]
MCFVKCFILFSLPSLPEILLKFYEQFPQAKFLRLPCAICPLDLQAGQVPFEFAGNGTLRQMGISYSPHQSIFKYAKQDIT